MKPKNIKEKVLKSIKKKDMNKPQRIKFKATKLNKEGKKQPTFVSFKLKPDYWISLKNVEKAIDHILAEVNKVIDEDIKYQKSKLKGNFEKDKPFKWRIEGCNYIKQKIKIK